MNCWIRKTILTSQKVFTSQSSSARVIITLKITFNLKAVAEQVLQSSECLGRKNRNLAVLIQPPGVAKRSNWQWSRAVGTTIDSTSNTFDRHEEFVASDSISWRQGKWKWSFLIAVRAIKKPLYEGLQKIEDNMNQDFRKSRLSNGDLELSSQAHTLLALLCKDEACAYVRSAEWQALLRARTARNATNFLHQFMEPKLTSPDPRINLRQ